MSAEETHEGVGAGRQPSAAAVCIGTIQMPNSAASVDLAAEVKDLKAEVALTQVRQQTLIRALANVTALMSDELERLLAG